MTLMSEAAGNSGLLLKGRQLLKLIFDYYHTDEDLGTLFELTDLMAVI